MLYYIEWRRLSDILTLAYTKMESLSKINVFYYICYIRSGWQFWDLYHNKTFLSCSYISFISKDNYLGLSIQQQGVIFLRWPCIP